MRIPVHNNTAMPMYVGANLVPPGETRDFEEHQVPAHLRPAAAPAEPEEAPPSTAEALQASSAKDVIAALANLSDEHLTELEALEQAAEKPRKTVIDAIAAEALNRAGGE